MRFTGLVVMIVSISGPVFAEQGCPDGMYPGGMRPNGPICVPMPGVGGGAGPPAPRFEERWGAVATDGAHGYVGVAEHMPSRNLAETVALTDCRRYYMDADCKVILAYANKCGVLVTSDRSHVAKFGATVAEAASSAMQVCANEGVICSVEYSSCSFAERVE